MDMGAEASLAGNAAARSRPFYMAALSGIEQKADVIDGQIATLRKVLDRVIDKRDKPEVMLNKVLQEVAESPVSELDYQLDELNMRLDARIKQLQYLIDNVRL